jgi:dihydroxy-acid dehydratase
VKKLKDYLNLDALTVTGKTLGENLRELEEENYFSKVQRFLNNYKVEPEAIIRNIETPLKKEGSIAVLKGNIAPLGCVVKKSAVEEKLYNFIGCANVFDSQDAALQALVNDKIQPQTVIVVRYEGPKGSGMPEMYYVTETLANIPELSDSVSIITDGRFSGAPRGPVIGHISPEAAEGGPIAVIKDDDLIEINIPLRKLDLIGVNNEQLPKEKINEMIELRLSQWSPPKPKITRGVLALYTKLATSASLGSYMSASNDINQR